MEAESTAQSLHPIRGVLTKFMRMLFPVEFRIDSLVGCDAMLPFHYPLLAGEMIYLPEKVESLASAESSLGYYLVTAAHLAARHEFGTFELKLADLPGFEDRGETGVEAIDSFVATFDDPGLASALLRLCETARVDAALRRRYRGLAPRVDRVNRALSTALKPGSLSTMLIHCALDLPYPDEGLEKFVEGAASLIAPLRQPGAGVEASAVQTGALYRWLKNLIAAARQAEADELARDAMRLGNDLASAGGLSDEQMPGGESSEEGEGGGEGESMQVDVSGREAKGGKGRMLTADEIRELLKQGAELKPAESGGENEGGGLYHTELTPKQAEELEQLREQLGEVGAGHAGRFMVGRNRDSYFAYDEWDYVLGDYRHNWCRLREVELTGDGGDFFAHTLTRYAELLPQVRRHFQRIRPASYRMVRGLEDGEEIDFDRTIESRVAYRMGQVPDDRVYKARKKEARDVATLFLLDMSASTDEPIAREAHTVAHTSDDWTRNWSRGQSSRPRRIIDVNKEALVIMAQALEEIGDSYAIMGFSGHGRDNVEFYRIKEFNSELSEEVKSRIGAIEPKRSTRMGTAIRHVREKFKDVNSRAKHMILLSDGFPQDFDYGHDRRSNAYGVQDTMVALKELEMIGVLPFCITVDRTGHDYLRQMCSANRYLVIDDITSLPRQLPKIYEQVVRW
ncbi:MAG TPA: VWA domain-containing protein [Candidatus Binataceae bacterium]|nr:VWA domain-containing protein [Candidatus Binataceae bacterium]